MSGNSRTRERECIETFVSLLRRRPRVISGASKLGRLEWIDGEEAGAGLPDARARPLLIEHFSIDNMPHQRRLSAQFLRMLDGLEEEFAGGDCLLTVAMPEDVAERGRDWKAQRVGPRNWLREDAPSLSIGHHERFRIEGLSDHVVLWKSSRKGPRGVVFKRWMLSGCRRLHERLQSAVAEKIGKLLKYRGDGDVCVLLIESEDITLMNAHEFLDTFHRAFPISGQEESMRCGSATHSLRARHRCSMWRMESSTSLTVSGRPWSTRLGFRRRARR